ncbi:permease [Aestuariicella hydrocarbonica]|uniref:Permease n=1 Tax=Pseudomaricurvus hydrocarbonicus TaxID=1470433 RepID=A0A9E5JX99_9GAMM|nr:permease [Aestuariicella hydrocarbonica]NHO66266.1 permease [Aestuariicella hydrocarbonica]
MLSIFTDLASLLVYTLAGLSAESRLGQSLHFFVEDTTKIFFLLVVMIYSIALLRASLNVEKVRDFLANRHKFVGYVSGSLFGAITPFCSCSSIPVFLGFTSAGIPVGITMAFLLTSPLINEVAVLLLFSLVGWKVTVLYVAVGLVVGIVCGLILDLLHAERLLQPFAYKAYQNAGRMDPQRGTPAALSLQQRHAFARQELMDILSRVWKWVFIGVGLGAALHGFVPEAWFEQYLGSGQWWSVPMAVLVGVPLYSNATGVIPVMESLLLKGLPLGTTMAFCMSTVAASFPEFILLKQVMQWKLLAIIFLMLLLAFTLVGWALNVIYLF